MKVDSTWNILQLQDAVFGFNAARQDQPRDATQSPEWLAGFDDWSETPTARLRRQIRSSLVSSSSAAPTRRAI